MASISDLPIELMLTIFKLIYDNDSQTNNSENDDVEGALYSDHSSIWSEYDFHSPTFFPMAIAYVCRLWRDILARSPEYWHRVVFEVGRDPTPLLDAFSWSNDSQILDVLVWNRFPDFTPAGKALENERVSAITKSLTPHFNRCSMISYEVAYASSLPSIATLFRAGPSILNHFVFECRVDDVQHEHLNNLTAMVVDSSVVPFSDLSVLSLGARLFIDLGRAHPNWLHNFRSHTHLTLTISQFRFQENIDGDGGGERYTVVELLGHLTAMPRPEVLRLRNLSLAYVPKISTSDTIYMRTASLLLDNLGENFLGEFFGRTRLVCENICINRCTIPWVDGLTLSCARLHLDNLGYIHNIHNILQIWHGHHLSLDSCAAFDDDLVDRLDDEGRNVYLNLLIALTVKDCINFTSAGLRKLMTIQKTMADYDNIGQMVLERVTVEGGRLSLCEEDISWFRHRRSETNVSWTIIHPDGTYAYPLNHYHDRLGED